MAKKSIAKKKAVKKAVKADKCVKHISATEILDSVQGPERKLRDTLSLCPECLAKIKAVIFERDGKVWIKKRCAEHGEIEELYWGDYKTYKRAEAYASDGVGVENPAVAKENPDCPRDCGLCKIHTSHTALANIAVTNRCDLSCWYCFFYAQKMGYVYEPGLGYIREMLRTLRNQKPVPCNAIQITGGEPTLRKDIIEIIEMAREEGFEHVQLNTNGIRMGNEHGFAKKVREAGVNTIYLSFDGVTAKTNPKNHWEIPAIFDECRKAGIGIVLVPTVINGVNDHELGDMVRFAFRNIDVVRAINFQPVSLVGKISKADRQKMRITIPDAMKRLQEQTGGDIIMDDFYPVPSVSAFTDFVEALTKKNEYRLSSHFACGMATYVFNSGGKIVPVTRFVDVPGIMKYLKNKAAELRGGRSKFLVGLGVLKDLNRFIDKEKAPKGFSVANIIYNALVKHNYKALGKFHHKSMLIGMMHFQDLYNYDVERVKRCCIHYAIPGGKIIPFCAFNVIPEWYRDKSQKEQGTDLAEWEKETGRTTADDLYKRDVKALEASQLYKKAYLR